MSHLRPLFVTYARRFLVPLPPLRTPPPPWRFHRIHIHRLSHEVQQLQARLGNHSSSLASEQPECNFEGYPPARGGLNSEDGTDQGGLPIEVRPMFNGVRKLICSCRRAPLPFPCTSSLLFRRENDVLNPSCEVLVHKIPSLHYSSSNNLHMQSRCSHDAHHR